MLHKDPFIIAPATFQLIQQLQALPELKDFYLMGGTALALQLGHRNSIDIDLFTRNEFDPDSIVDFLSIEYSVNVSLKRKSTLLAEVNNIKTDLIRHDHALVKGPITEEGITFLSIEDIAAMKLNAIVNSGKRLKDFIDVYYLLQHFSVNDMIGFFKIKYPNYSPMIPLKALVYFGDIDPALDVPKLKKRITLAQIKKRIEDAVLHGNKVFN